MRGGSSLGCKRFVSKYICGNEDTGEISLADWIID